jgi:hypothetical protein
MVLLTDAANRAAHAKGVSCDLAIKNEFLTRSYAGRSDELPTDTLDQRRFLSVEIGNAYGELTRIAKENITLFTPFIKNLSSTEFGGRFPGRIAIKRP